MKTEWLADVPLQWVLLVVLVLGVLLLFLKLYPGRHDPKSIAFADNVQVLLTVIVGVFLIIRPLLFQAFYIPSGSMEPTLLGPKGSDGASLSQGAGDRLIVNKLIYRVSNPHRGDIAVFRAPKAANPEEKDFIKRVIGEPNDVVEVFPTRLLLDGNPVLEMGDWDALVKPVPQEPYSADGKSFNRNTSEPVLLLVRPDPQVRIEGGRLTVDGKVVIDEPGKSVERESSLASLNMQNSPDGPGELFLVDGLPRLALFRGRELLIDPGHTVVNGRRLREPYIAEAPDYRMEPMKLGSDQYLMLGDNRNQSADGHIWGSVTRDRFVGRAEIIFWPFNRFLVIQWWLISVLFGLWCGWQMFRFLWLKRRPESEMAAEAELPGLPESPGPLSSTAPAAAPWSYYAATDTPPAENHPDSLTQPVPPSIAPEVREPAGEGGEAEPDSPGGTSVIQETPPGFLDGAQSVGMDGALTAAPSTGEAAERCEDTVQPGGSSLLHS